MSRTTFIRLTILLGMATDLAVSGALAVLRNDEAGFRRASIGWVVGLALYILLSACLRRR